MSLSMSFPVEHSTLSLRPPTLPLLDWEPRPTPSCSHLLGDTYSKTCSRVSYRALNACYSDSKGAVSYHVVKDVAFYSDHMQNETLVTQVACSSVSGLARDCFDLVTQLNGTVLPVRVYEYRAGPFGKGPLRRDIWIGDQHDRPVSVFLKDGPALKGAFHVCHGCFHVCFNKLTKFQTSNTQAIDRLLVPPQLKHHPGIADLLEDHPDQRLPRPFSPHGPSHPEGRSPPRRG